MIDPIDGTSNFLRGSPLWGISLGHVSDGRPDIGIIAHPAFGDLLCAADGFGLIVNGIPTAPRCDHGERAGYAVQSFRCSTISLSFAARGFVDGHVQHVTSMWDIAGGAVLCREAGLSMTISRQGPEQRLSIPAANSTLATSLKA